MQHWLSEFIAFCAIGFLLYAGIGIAALVMSIPKKYLKLIFIVDIILYILPAIIDYITKLNNIQNNIISAITAILYIIAFVLSIILLVIYTKSKK